MSLGYLADGCRRIRQIVHLLQTFGSETAVLFLQFNDSLFVTLGQATRGMLRSTGMVPQTLQGAIEAPEPFTDGFGGGYEEDRRRLHPVLLRLSDHSQSMVTDIFTFSHQCVVWARTHGLSLSCLVSQLTGCQRIGYVSIFLELDLRFLALTRFGLRPSRVRARSFCFNSCCPFLPKQSSFTRGVPCVILFPLLIEILLDIGLVVVL